MLVSLQLLLIVLSIVATGFYAGMETGVVAINRLRLSHLVRKGKHGAAILEDFLEHPDHLLGTTLVGTNLFTILASITTVSLGSRIAGHAGTLTGEAIITVLLLVFSEYLPKAWFQGRPATRTMPLARLLRFNGHLLYPISRGATLIARVLMPAPAVKEDIPRPFITLDELKHLTKEGQETGALKDHERRMIDGVFDLGQKTCREMMVPRDQIIHVLSDAPADDVLQIARENRLSRLPVLKGNRFVGSVYIFDIFALDDYSGRCALDLMRPPQFVTANTPLDDLLPRMRMNRQPMALVTDERSEVIGLVTLDIILQEIVGELLAGDQ